MLLTRPFLIIFLSALITAGGYAFAEGAPSFQPSQCRPVPNFTNIHVVGDFNVSLHTGYAQPKVILHGDPRDLAGVDIGVIQNTLHVIADDDDDEDPRYGQIQVEIRASSLHGFEYQGAGVITGLQLHAPFMSVLIDNPGKTTLKGYIGLHRLDVKGGGHTEISGIHSPGLWVRVSDQSQVKLGGVVNLRALDVQNDGVLSLYWVKSDTLTVRAKGRSFIQLAGIVNHLDVELWDRTTFKGRYLRAQRAVVKTHQQSVAEISAIKRQHTLAKDSSDIHFFTLPEMKTDFMAHRGATLDMRDLAPPLIQESNQYNQ